MKKKSVIAAAAVCSILIIAGVGRMMIKADDGTEEITEIVKETTVERGNLVTGVSESGSMSLGSITQEFTLDLSGIGTVTSVSSTGSSSSSSGSTGSDSSSSGGTGSGSSSSGGTGSGSSSSGGTKSSSLSSSNSSSSSETTSGSSTSGGLFVEEIYVSQGQKIQKGDAILKVTDESLKNVENELAEAVEAAELTLKQAKIEDEQTEAEAKNTYDLAVAEGEVAEAVYQAALAEIDTNISSLQSQLSSTSDSEKAASLQAQLTKAQREAAAKKLEAKQEYEETMLNYENAKTEYDIAIQDVGSAEQEAKEELEETKELQKEFLQIKESDGVLSSEYEGIVLSTGYVAGDELSTQTPLVEFADEESYTVSVDVTEDDISKVQLEDQVLVKLLAYEGEEYEGIVTEIGTAVSEASTVSYPVTVTLTSYPEKIYNGMTADVTFVTKKMENVLYVSNKAIFTEGTRSFVKVKKSEDEVITQEVETGFSDGVSVEIKQGLEEGDTVLIESKVSEKE